MSTPGNHSGGPETAGQPYQGQYQPQPHQGQPYTAQPYPGQQYSGQPYPAQPHAAQPYGGQPYPTPQDQPQHYQPYGYAGQPMPGAPPYAQYAQPQGPVGQVRGTGVTILLFFVTLGIYGLVYYFQTHEEMKRHTGNGLGGAIALVLALFVGVASPFLLSSEVGQLYERAGRPKPVSAATGAWVLPVFLLMFLPIYWALNGINLIGVVLALLILAAPFVWFVKTNNALNAYWESVGAR